MSSSPKRSDLLLGREKEIEEIERLYQSVKKEDYSSDCKQRKQQTHVLIISGPRGCGKTALAETLIDYNNIDHGMYVQWKFDPLQHLQLEAGRGFDECFGDSLEQLAADSKANPEPLQWLRKKAKLIERQDREAIIKEDPRMRFLLGDDYDENNVAAADAADDENDENDDDNNVSTAEAPTTSATVNASRSASVSPLQSINQSYYNMLRIFRSKERPGIFVLDDFHFADPSSFFLMSRLFHDHRNEGLLIVVTCVLPHHLHDDDIEDDGVGENLGESSEDILKLIHGMGQDDKVGMLHLDLGERSISDEAFHDIVHYSWFKDMSEEETKKRSGGDDPSKLIRTHIRDNLSFGQDFVSHLRSTGSTFTREEMEETMKQFPSHKDTLLGKLRSLDESMQQLLKVSACLGYWINREILQRLFGSKAFKTVQDAMVHGVLTRSPFCSSNGVYRFASNAMHRATYAFIGDGNDNGNDNNNDDQVDLLHYTLGRKLWKYFVGREGAHENDVVQVLTQLNLGSLCIQDQPELYAVAQLALEGAQIALRWNGFYLALCCLRVGLDFCDRQFWRDEYQLALTLHNSAAEAAYAAGEYSSVDECIESVRVNARQFEDTVQSETTGLIMMTTNTEKPFEALDIGRKILARLGETFPKRPSTLCVIKENFRIKRVYLRGKSVRQILMLPNMQDSRKLAAMKVMNAVISAAFVTNSNLAPLLAFRMVQLSMDYGLCAISAFGFAIQTMALCSVFRNLDEARKMSEIAYGVLDRFGARQWLPRVSVMVHGSITSWSDPVTNALEPLHKGFHVAIETGDIEFALWSSSIYSIYQLGFGKPLLELRAMTDKFTESIRMLRRFRNETMKRPLDYILDRLVDGNWHPETAQPPTDTVPLNQGFGQEWFYYQRTFVCYFLEEFDMAVHYTSKFRSATKFRQDPGSDSAMLFCLDALSRLAAWKKRRRSYGSGDCITGLATRQLSLHQARRSLRDVDKISQVVPEYCLGKLYLVKAEFASLKGRKSRRAMQMYKSAIATTQASGILHEQAMAQELTGLYLLNECENADGLAHMRQACKLYSIWGARWKAQKIREDLRKYQASLLPSEST